MRKKKILIHRGPSKTSLAQPGLRIPLNPNAQNIFRHSERYVGPMDIQQYHIRLMESIVSLNEGRASLIALPV